MFSQRLLWCKLIRKSLILTWAACFWAHGNQKPFVDAGGDQTNVSTQSTVFLSSTIVDDSTSIDSLTVRWRLKSGPATFQLADSTSSTTIAFFAQAGIYVFELWVSDGSLWASDTTTITVHEALQFRVLRPTANEQVEIGKPYTIRWQMEPSVPCEVYYSFDGWRTRTKVTMTGAKMDSVVWGVDSSFSSGTQGSVGVFEYQNESHSAEKGSFVLVNHPPQSVLSGQLPRARPIRVLADGAGVLSLHGLPGGATASATIFDASGKWILGRPAANGVVGSVGQSHSSGFLIYVVTTQRRAAQIGKLVAPLR